MPGLWDVHGHLTFWGGDALALLATAGVTSVRDMGGDLDQLLTWRAATAEGRLFGPRVFTAGWFLDGPKPNFQWRRFATTAQEGEDAVLELAGRGVDLIKVHSRLPREALIAALETAGELGLPVAGHVPIGLTPQEVSELGFASIEHVNSLLSGLARAEGSPASNWNEAYPWWCSEPGARAMQAMAERGTRVTPDPGDLRNAAVTVDPRVRGDRSLADRAFAQAPRARSDLARGHGLRAAFRRSRARASACCASWSSWSKPASRRPRPCAPRRWRPHARWAATTSEWSKWAPLRTSCSWGMIH